jgi:hypothetical protein
MEIIITNMFINIIGKGIDGTAWSYVRTPQATLGVKSRAAISCENPQAIKIRISAHTAISAPFFCATFTPMFCDILKTI